MSIRTRVLRTWIGWISTFGNFGVALAKFVWGCETPTTILTLYTNCSWSIMIHRLKPEKRLLQVKYLNFGRYGRQLISRSKYLFSIFEKAHFCWLLESVTARTKHDHWVLGLPRHRWYTVHSRLRLEFILYLFRLEERPRWDGGSDKLQ